MCGIIGIVGGAPVQDRLVAALKRLEYRGYDSAGIAGVVSGRVERRRAEGRIHHLEEVLKRSPLNATLGIGHTRWATHGAPSERNAHPHRAGAATVVHNGIIENFAELRCELQGRGRHFESDGDSEVIAHLLDEALQRGTPMEALRRVTQRLRGAYAIAAVVEGLDDLIFGARSGSPLVVGYGRGEMIIGSDALALGPLAEHIVYLEEGDLVAIDREGALIHDAEGRRVVRPLQPISFETGAAEKGPYRHFMEKEMFEQADACQRTLTAYVDALTGLATAPGDVDFAQFERLQIVACGTSSYAGQIARYMFEGLAGLPTEVEVASEFRYREPALPSRTLVLGISQSGETADTLAALRWSRGKGFPVAAMVNAPQSTMWREADVVWPTRAGPEIGVASTKAFTSQVAALLALSIAAARARGVIDASREQRLTRLLLQAPRLLAESMETRAQILALAPDLSGASSVLYLGRGAMYPLAHEAALKLKEISYIHAEAYAAGELKHGPIALIGDGTPVVVLAPSGELFDKTMSNLQEVAARGGKIVLITDAEGAEKAPKDTHCIVAPRCDPFIAPLVYAAPVQLLAYHVALELGGDIDKPRNLAKSVTVE